MRGIQGAHPGNPYIPEGFSLCPPIPPQIRLSLACPFWPLLSSSNEVRPLSRELCICVVLQLWGQPPLPSLPFHPRSLMGKGSQWLLRYARPQEIVENSLSRTSWLSVWKARFLLTLVLMDRTWERVGESRRAQAKRKERVGYKQ